MKSWYSKVDALFDKERYEIVIAKCRKVLTKDKNHQDALFFLAYSYYKLWQNRRAVHYWERLKQINPDYPYLNVNLGCTYRDLGENKLAKAYYKKELELFPLCKQAIARCYFFEKPKNWTQKANWFGGISREWNGSGA